MVEVRILTQIEENYGFYVDKNHWKKKGGQEFTMNVDDSLMMYGEKDVIIKSFQKFLDLESNDLERFIYVSHELVFNKSYALKGDLSKVYVKIIKEIEINKEEEEEEKEETNHVIAGVDFSESMRKFDDLF